MKVILAAGVSKLQFLTRLTTINVRWSGASAAFRDGSTEEGKLATEKDCPIPLADKLSLNESFDYLKPKV